MTLNAKNLFLIDAIGAVISFFFLAVVLVYFEDKIGMPVKVLYLLAAAPVFFAIYSFSCYYMLKKKHRIYLKGIAILNLVYCFFTIALLVCFDHRLTLLGWAYFIIELFVLGILITLEFQASNTYSKKNLNA